MGYSTVNDVKFYGQFSSDDFEDSVYSETDGYLKAMQDADRMIDNYCNQPEGFFTAGGIVIQQEYRNGTEVAYLGGITKFFNWYYGGTSHLKVTHTPVLTVVKLEEETSADSWTTRTEGTGNDYIVVDDGVRFVTNTPAWKYKNVRITYKAGYATTPGNVQQVSARLAAALLQRILDAKNRESTAVPGVPVSPAPDASLSKPVFSQELKDLLNNYRRVVYGFS